MLLDSSPLKYCSIKLSLLILFIFITQSVNVLASDGHVLQIKEPWRDVFAGQLGRGFLKS